MRWHRRNCRAQPTWSSGFPSMPPKTMLAGSPPSPPRQMESSSSSGCKSELLLVRSTAALYDLPIMRIVATLIITLLMAGLTSHAQAAGKLHHVVCFKFKSSASPQDIKQVTDAFMALKDKIPGIENLKWGTNVS